MYKDEETEIKDKAIRDDLLAAGYIEEVKSKRKVKTNEN